MPNEPLGVGLLGLGRAGGFHLKSLRQMTNAVVRCVCDVNEQKAQQIAQTHDCSWTTSPDELIERSDVDAIIVATPTDRHYELVKKGLHECKPVLTEKPLGRHLHEIDASFELASSSATPLFVAFQRRFDPSFSALIQAVRDGDLGQLQFVRSVSRDNPIPSSAYIAISGGIFHDCIVHDLDMVCAITGEVPTHMSSFASSFVPEIGELGDFDNVVATLMFSSGVTAMIDVSRKSVYGYDQRIEAFGDGGMLQVGNHHITSLTKATPTGFTRPPIDYSFPTRYQEAYRMELECFVRCARDEQPVPISHVDVRTNHLLACGLEIAANEKRVVDFAEIEPRLAH